MLEEIQKSVQLINFSDSIFDPPIKPEETGLFDGEMSKIKIVLFDELMQKYFFEEEETEEVIEILVVYWPFAVDSQVEFEEIIRRQQEFKEKVERKCFGRRLTGKDEEVLKFHGEIFGASNLVEINVLGKKPLKCQINLKSSREFDVEKVARTITLMEATEYVRLNILEFYGKTTTGTTTATFLEIFNNLTNFLISEILSVETDWERREIVKKILKLAKRFAENGAMNSLKSCLAALESNPIHRLHVISQQPMKYQKRFKNLSKLASPDRNYETLRGTGCLVPWLGIILRDFTFIKEVQTKTCGREGKTVNIPLANCLRTLIKSMTAARESCREFVESASISLRSEAAVMRKWLRECEIRYGKEEEQYERSCAFMREGAYSAYGGVQRV